ncbi:hypothetical protein AGOR_G00185180 [Albula goreensis]|uniref:Interleukin-17 receptor C/E N-terminal domain-containing protein n=1 Tax=Albula goreensis TaxID=1534307 RepID=A0A8T3CXQ2_9TELE|nr:hypothetical protein AGOR_G00185180 [Albula goreensis]
MRATVILTLIVWGVLAQEDQIQRINECGARCTQGLRCKAQHHFPALFAACKRDPALINSTVFHRVNLSTVMKCDKIQKCSLHLRVTATVQIYERLQGVSVCTVSSGMLEYCRVVTFPRKARGRLVGQQVEVQDDCVEVAPNQNVNVMLKTHPEYCDITWSQVYRVQGCGNAVLRSNVPECITGKIAYTVDEVKRELSVTVSDMLEDRDYHLRLCHRWEICSGTEAYTLLKREESLKRATLQYSSPLPCLCIEGWSAMADAPRVQVCPFRNRTEELWSGVTFDPEREALSWEPACPVKAVVTLCQRERGNICHDLANSSQPVGREKVTYSKVDPHPTICMKFTTDSGSWIKCPFAARNFLAWNLTMMSGPDQKQAVLKSQIRTKLSLRVCRNRTFLECDESILVTMEENSVSVNLTKEICQPNTCIQARRADVQFSIPALQCGFQCSERATVSNGQYLCRVEWLLVFAITCVMLVIIAGLAGNIILTVYQRRRANRKPGSYHQFERTAVIHPLTAVKLLHAEDGKDYTLQSSGDLEKFMLGLGMPDKFTVSDSMQNQHSLCVKPTPASQSSPLVERL